MFSIQKDAIAAPATIDSSIFLPAICDERIPPAKASPAPVVSITLLTGYAFTEKEVVLSKKVAPSSPCLMIRLSEPKPSMLSAISFKL